MNRNRTIASMGRVAVIAAVVTVAIMALMAAPEAREQGAWTIQMVSTKVAAVAGFYAAHMMMTRWRRDPWIKAYLDWCSEKKEGGAE